MKLLGVKRLASARTHPRVRMDLSGARGFRGLKTENRNFFLSFQDGNNYQKQIYFFCVCADVVFTASADGKNPSAGKTASVG
jgi:hypothetical protein